MNTHCRTSRHAWVDFCKSLPKGFEVEFQKVIPLRTCQRPRYYTSQVPAVKQGNDLKFNIMPQELEMHMQRVEKMREIIEQCAGLRLEHYKGYLRRFRGFLAESYPSMQTCARRRSHLPDISAGKFLPLA